MKSGKSRSMDQQLNHALDGHTIDQTLVLDSELLDYYCLENEQGLRDRWGVNWQTTIPNSMELLQKTVGYGPVKYQYSEGYVMRTLPPFLADITYEYETSDLRSAQAEVYSKPN